MTQKQINIGDEFWVFDNTQEFRQGGNVYKKVKVIGETRMSWLITPEFAPVKIPKRDPKALMTDVEKEQHRWVRENVHLVTAKITRNIPYDDLRRIAAIVGHHA